MNQHPVSPRSGANARDASDRSHSRRRLLAAVAAGGLAGTQATAPGAWAPPVVRSLLLPAHAQATPRRGLAEGYGAAIPIAAGVNRRGESVASRAGMALANTVLEPAAASSVVTLNECRLESLDVYVTGAPVSGAAHLVQIKARVGSCRCSASSNGDLPAYEILLEGMAAPGAAISTGSGMEQIAGCTGWDHPCAVTFAVDAGGTPMALSSLRLEAVNGDVLIDTTNVPLTPGQAELSASNCPTEVVLCGCIPNCSGKACGDDGCGGSCGSCASGSLCVDGDCVPA